MSPKSSFFLIASLLHAVLIGTLWVSYFARNEGTLSICLAVCFLIEAVLILGLLVSLFFTKTAGARSFTVLALLINLGIVCLGFAVAPSVKKRMFERDRFVLERAVREVRATGQSNAWQLVAYSMRVYPKVGKPSVVEFCVARDRGYDCQWYRWTEQVYPTPDKTRPRAQGRGGARLNHYWVTPQWSEFTFL
jgi:F0F1-type ATP synthase membrane subunit c/vacuolar-type H+-ATPase subunit K